MEEGKIVIQGVRLSHLKPGQSPVIRVSEKAYNLLIDLANESGGTLFKISTEIIEQAIEKDLIRLERTGSGE